MNSSNLIIPLSIVVAGMIIGSFTASAIIYTNRYSLNSQAATGQLRPTQNGLAEAPVVAPATGNMQVRALTARAVTKQDHVLGSLNAPVKLIDYSDLECPFCKRHQDTLNRLTSSFAGESFARVYRHYPLSFHIQAMPEAVAAECVAKLAGEAAFWKFTDKIFTVTPSNDGLDLNKLPEYAAEAGVNNIDAFSSCYESAETQHLVEADMEDGESAGVSGTPYAFVTTEKALNEEAKDEIFALAVDMQLESQLTFAEDGKAIGISGALPYEAFASVVDYLISYN